MTLKKRIKTLEESAGMNEQPDTQVVLLADVDGIGRDAMIERWKAENGPVAGDIVFIFLTAMV